MRRAVRRNAVARIADSSLVLLHASRTLKSPVVYVGDRHQQIYSFRRAINAMSSVDAQRSFYLTRSFRFGENIAAFATRVLSLLDEEKAVIGGGAAGRVVVGAERSRHERRNCRSGHTRVSRSRVWLPQVDL